MDLSLIQPQTDAMTRRLVSAVLTTHNQSELQPWGSSSSQSCLDFVVGRCQTRSYRRRDWLQWIESEMEFIPLPAQPPRTPTRLIVVSFSITLNDGATHCCLVVIKGQWNGFSLVQSLALLLTTRLHNRCWRSVITIGRRRFPIQV